jgi:hypothetical protein
MTVDYQPIQDFLKRVRSLGNTSGAKKELRLSIEEANRLAVNIAELMTDLARGSNEEEVVQIVVDGGSFT